MIQANELRLGNWVRYIGIGNKGEHDYCQIHELKYGEEKTGIKPIPLTPNLLEKCGFNKKGELRYELSMQNWCTLHLIEVKKAPGWFVSSISGGFGMVSLPNMQYVHQLQNSHFSLTNTELQINLNQ